MGHGSREAKGEVKRVSGGETGSLWGSKEEEKEKKKQRKEVIRKEH